MMGGRGVWRHAVAGSVLVVFLLAAASCGNGDSEGGDAREGLIPVTFRLDWIITSEHTAFFAIKEKGFFEEEGLDVELLEGGGSALSLQLVGNKTDDFGLATFGALASARAEGSPAVMVAGVYSSDVVAVLSLESTGIETPQDLVGKRVANAPGSATTILWPVFLAANDLEEDDVKLISIDAGAYNPAILEGRIDAIAGGWPPGDGTQLELRAEEPVSFMYWADWGVEGVIRPGIVVHPDTIENDPELVRAFTRALQKGFEWVAENPDEAAKIMDERFPQTVDLEVARRSLEHTLGGVTGGLGPGQPIGYLDPDLAEQVIELQKEYAGLELDVPPDELFTNEFLED